MNLYNICNWKKTFLSLTQFSFTKRPDCFFYSISVCASGAEPERPDEAARQAGPYLEQGEGGDAAGAPGGLQGSARGGDHSRPAFSCSVDHYSLYKNSPQGPVYSSASYEISTLKTEANWRNGEKFERKLF